MAAGSSRNRHALRALHTEHQCGAITLGFDCVMLRACLLSQPTCARVSKVTRVSSALAVSVQLRTCARPAPPSPATSRRPSVLSLLLLVSSTLGRPLDLSRLGDVEENSASTRSCLLASLQASRQHVHSPFLSDGAGLRKGVQGTLLIGSIESLLNKSGQTASTAASELLYGTYDLFGTY